MTNEVARRFLLVSGVLLTAIALPLWASDATAGLLLPLIAAWKGQPPAPHWLAQLHMIGRAFLIVGIANTAIASLILPRRAAAGPLAERVPTILLIWLLVAMVQFSLAPGFNEHDTLPIARQFVDHAWLPGDWYLNQGADYRFTFNALIGVLVSLLGFSYGAYTGQLLGYAVFAVALHTFFRAFRLPTSFALLALLWFLFHQSLVAGEWMVGGAETKTFAYAFVLLSLSAFFRRRYLLGFVFAGAALSFHVLVGLYALFSIGVTLALTGELRAEWRRCLSQSWPMLVTGVFGIRAVIDQLLARADVDAPRAWEIYVRYRVPHHTLPSSWPGSTWVLHLSLAVALFAALSILARRSRAIRFLAAYGLGAALLFGIGLAIYAWGDARQLRFYWFRFPDTVVPFLTTMLIALVLTRLAPHPGPAAAPPSAVARGRAAVLASAPLLLAVATTSLAVHRLYGLQVEHMQVQEVENRALGARAVLHWIAQNTPAEARFLVDPTMSEFYVEAQRSPLVSFKLCPHNAAGILEWYKRITLCNGGREPALASFDSFPELRAGFSTLDAAQIRRIAREYDIDFHVGAAQSSLPFRQAYSDARFTVYRLDEGP